MWAYNTRLIEQEIENNLNVRVLRSKQCRSRSRIGCMIDTQRNIQYEKAEIVKIIKKFYEDLYVEGVPAPITAHNRQEIRNVGSEEIPDVTRDEVRAALKEMKNRKSPDEDRMTAEMLKRKGIALEDALCLFDKCLEKEQIPERWKNAEIIILFKKRNSARIENYRLISLLNVFYKLLTKVIIKRLTNKLDRY